MARPARSRRRCIATTRRVGALQTRMAPPESSRRARPLRNLPHAQLRVAEAGCASPPPSGLAQAPDANHAINFSAHPPSLSVLAPQRAGRPRPHCVRRAVRLGRNARTLYSAFGACTARFKGPNGCQAARLAGEPDSFVKSAVVENGFAPPPDPPAAWRDVLRATQASRLVAGLLRAHACRNANGPACPAMTRMFYNEEMSTAKLFGRRITWAAIRPKCLRPVPSFPRNLPHALQGAPPARLAGITGRGGSGVLQTSGAPPCGARDIAGSTIMDIVDFAAIFMAITTCAQSRIRGAGHAPPIPRDIRGSFVDHVPKVDVRRRKHYHQCGKRNPEAVETNLYHGSEDKPNEKDRCEDNSCAYDEEREVFK